MEKFLFKKKEEFKVKETPKEKVMVETTTLSKNPFASKECIDILNFRIQQEEQSSRLYQSMSLWLNDNGFKGSAKSWAKDAEDEMKHAGWAKQYLLDMGIQPKIPALKEPLQSFTGLPDIIRKSYEHEIVVTQQCNDLASHALKYNNHLLYQLAIKYMQEQQEEIKKLTDMLDRLSIINENDKLSILILDQEIGDGKI